MHTCRRGGWFSVAAALPAEPGGEQPKYEVLVTKVLETTTKAGLKVGGPLAWKDSRKGYAFFQGPNEAALIGCGARVSLNMKPSGCPSTGMAATEGSEK